MWLLTVKTLELEHFPDHRETPKYAILSHTWGADEVMFQDMRDAVMETTMKKQGYRKIQHTCRQALQDKLEYAWVDTCYIDKSSSAELTEAINSMFAFDEESEVCYAYLADVDLDRKTSVIRERRNSTSKRRRNGEDGSGRPIDFADVPAGLDHDDGAVRTSASGHQNHGQRASPATNSSQDDDYLVEILPAHIDEVLIASLRHSAWFTRGWTLQELLAPRRLIFYSQQWIQIGSLQHLAPIVTEITTIPLSLLCREVTVASYSAARRMSWASRRKTTRIEDEAYCLFGIFQVNLPLLYGERDKAFRRLQEEILTTSGDLSLLAWDRRTPADNTHGPESPFILSPSPAYFASSGFIVRTSRSSRLPMSMRPEGLHLPAALVMGELIALDCYDERFRAYAVGLFTEQQGGSKKDEAEGVSRYIVRTCDRLGLFLPRKFSMKRSDIVLIHEHPQLVGRSNRGAGPFHVRLLQHTEDAAYLMKVSKVYGKRNGSISKHSLYRMGSDKSPNGCGLVLRLEPISFGKSQSETLLPTWEIEIHLPSLAVDDTDTGDFALVCSTWPTGETIMHTYSRGKGCETCVATTTGRWLSAYGFGELITRFGSYHKEPNALLTHALGAGYQIRVEALEAASTPVVLAVLEKLDQSNAGRVRSWLESCFLHLLNATIWRSSRLSRYGWHVLSLWPSLTKPAPDEKIDFMDADEGKLLSDVLKSPADVDRERRRYMRRHRRFQITRKDDRS